MKNLLLRVRDAHEIQGWPELLTNFRLFRPSAGSEQVTKAREKPGLSCLNLSIWLRPVAAL